MLKDDILDLINNFEMETWKYNTSDNLNKDMQYIYYIEKEVKNAPESDLKTIYEKLLSVIGIIRFKYGFESIIVNSDPEFENFKKIVDNISLDSNDIINQYNYISTVYSNSISRKKNLDFIENKYAGIQGKEGLYLAVESLKSLVINNEYRQLLGNNQANEILIDCVRLNENSGYIKYIESKYKGTINKIWANSLSNSMDANGQFKMLFSNISGGNLRETANLLINRPDQSSCSMISSNFIATYGSNTRRIGFIYPNNSEIIMASTFDLGSNVFGEGFTNKEEGTLLATPEAIEKIGIKRAKDKGEDLYSSSCYNEVLVNAKPCGIVVIGLGEKDLNIDYQEAKMLSLEMHLPIHYIDTMQYKDKLSEVDKNYIAFHSIMSYLGISTTDLSSKNNDYNNIYELINIHKEQIAEMFLNLKNSGNISKENMCQMMGDIINTQEFGGKSK